MDARWQQVREALETVLQHPPEERTAILDRVCHGDDALRARVSALLSHNAKGEDYPEPPDTSLLRSAFSQVVCTNAFGKRVGPYEIVEVIALGGMGAVYRAIRVDGLSDQCVAIKLIRGGMDTEHILRRFDRERRMLANLRHPGITAFLDAGSTDDGQPYLVMEYVEGKPIDRYCDEHRLTITERLELFGKVCSAVHYAHQNLVVHRDLKPRNILVDREGSPKLLDFGISMLLNGDGVPPREQTATLYQVMTPQYASPEQILGEPITTSSDVYSLGVILYELLTGHRPYVLADRSRRAGERAICEQEPPTPSTAVMREATSKLPDGTTRTVTRNDVSMARREPTERLRRRLSGDLDDIVGMAMRKDPKRRYASVQQFCDDIERHANALPILARKDTIRYRSAKFVRRNKLPVVAACVVTVSLVLGTVLSTVFYLREADARRLEEQARKQADIASAAAADQAAQRKVAAQRAEQMSAFLQDQLLVLVTPENHERLEETAERVLQRLGDQPQFQSDILTTIGMTYYKLRMYELAVPHLRDALAIRRRLHDEPHKDVAAALTTYSKALVFVRRLDEAEPLAEEALAMWRSLSGDDHYDTGTSYENLAKLYHLRGEPDRAVPMYEEALDIYRGLETKGHESPTAAVLNNLASLQRDRGEYGKAEALYREALAIAETAMRDQPGQKAFLHLNLGVCLAKAGRLADAEQELLASLAGLRQAAEPEPNVEAAVLKRLITLYETWRKPEKAAPFRSALSKLEAEPTVSP